MKNFREIVDRYAALAENFGEPVALSAFALSEEETQNLFSTWDEDYHISRFLHFIHGNGTTYLVSGEPVTHVSFDAEIRSIL